MEPFALCTCGSVHLRVTDKTDKEAVSARKEERKKRMHDEIGLLVDTPRAGGSGTTNTGNTARKAFQNESKFAEILGIDLELIHRIPLVDRRQRGHFAGLEFFPRIRTTNSRALGQQVPSFLYASIFAPAFHSQIRYS